MVKTMLAGVIVVVSLAGCSATSPMGRGLTECPPPPASELGPQSLGENALMDDVAEETSRFGQGLVGMTSEQAEACAIDAGYTWRVFEQDGEQFALTMDYRVDRINVKIEQGIITEAYSG